MTTAGMRRVSGRHSVRVSGRSPVQVAWRSTVRLSGRPGGGRRFSLRHPAWIVTPLALLVALWGLGRPSLWIDEAATWSAIDRSLSDLFALAGQKDRALFPYYLCMHFWGKVSMAEGWLRLPSALAATGAAGCTAAIGTRLWSARAGLVAGLLLIATPDWSRYAQEARPYAFAMLFTAIATWILVRSVDSDNWWPAYTTAIVGAVAAHFVTLLVLCAHAAGVVRRNLTPGPGLRDESPMRAWAESAGFAVLPGMVLVAWSVTQPAQQLTWSRPGPAELATVWSQVVGSTELAVLLAVLVAGCVWRRLAPVLLLAWLLVPPIAVFSAAQLTPLWAPRYLLFILPAGVLLAGILLGSLRPVVAAVTVAGAVAMAAPALVAVRTPGGHGQDYRAAAALIGRDATPRTAVLLSPSWQRSGLAYYLDGAAVDVMTSGPRPRDALHAPEAPAGTVAARLAATDRVWWVRLDDRDRALDARDRAKKAALDRWFRPVLTVRLEGLVLTRYERGR